MGDWSDITDLDYSKDVALWDELIETLKYWAALGVDGYRCDVASFVPVEFWLRARREVAEINPDFIWLAESVDGGFINYIRSQGFEVHSDCEMYQAFDICYDYDVDTVYPNRYLMHPTFFLLRKVLLTRLSLPEHHLCIGTICLPDKV